MTRHLMFFDDYPADSETKLFLYNLNHTLKATDVSIHVEKTIPHLEDALGARPYDAIVLDIMSAFPENHDLEAVAGIEILRRARAGKYGPINRQTLIYIRTARGELHVKQLAFECGCTDYFRAGSQDDKLLEELVRQLVK